MTDGFTFDLVTDAAAWSAFYDRAAGMTYAQTWAYAQTLASDQGAHSDHVVISRAGRAVALAAVRVKRVPALPVAISYVSRGPVLLDDAGGVDYAALVDALGTWCLERRAGTVRIAPPVLAEPPSTWPPAAGGRAWETSDQDYFTIVMDLDRPLDELRKALKQKWRNQLNAGQRKELAIEVDDSPGAVARFAPLYDAIVTRKGFASVLGPEFYDRVQRAAVESDRPTVIFARHEEEDVAGVVVWLRSGTATYILGASTEASMPLKASYLLQWAAIERAHARGCRHYDLGGIDPEGNPGVYHFKSGMGGREVRTPPVIERASSRVVGSGLKTLERFYRKRRAAQAAQADQDVGADEPSGAS